MSCGNVSPGSSIVHLRKANVYQKTSEVGVRKERGVQQAWTQRLQERKESSWTVLM